MKLVVYGPMNRHGFLVDNQVLDAQKATEMYLSHSEGDRQPAETATAYVGSDLLGFINGGERTLSTARKVISWWKQAGVNDPMVAMDANSVKLKPPLVNSYMLKVMCAGGNYADHLQGTSRWGPGGPKTIEQITNEAKKDVMWGFYKLGGNIVGDGDLISYPSRTSRLDYEGEIAIVFGKQTKDIKAANYLDYVFGVTLLNDVSIRDGMGRWDKQGSPMTFQLMKNFDGSGVMGPCIVTKDEVPDPSNVEFWTRVNGETRQKGNTKDMIRSFAEFAELLSTDLIVRPGDVISGGTCAGTALDSSDRDANHVLKPDRFLKVGDVVEVGSPSIGKITNRIVGK